MGRALSIYLHLRESDRQNTLFKTVYMYFGGWLTNGDAEKVGQLNENHKSIIIIISISSNSSSNGKSS